MPVVETRNLFTNPDFEATSGLVEVRRNLSPNPSLEVSLGTYAVGQNCTVARVAGTMVGSYVLEQTVTASGSSFVYDSAATDGVAVTAGVSYAVSSEVRAVSGLRPMDMGIVFRTNVGAVAGSVTYGAAITPTSLGVGQRVSHVVIAPAGAVRMQVVFRSASAVAGDKYQWDAVLIEASTTVGVYFDGSTSPETDLTSAWVGTVGASASTLTAPAVAAVTATNAQAIQSSAWDPKSMRLISAGADSYVTLRNWTAADAGKTFTVIAKVRLTAPWGTDPSYARSFFITQSVGGTMQGPKAPNAAGVYELRWTFTLNAALTSGTLRVYHGAAAGNPDLWVSRVTIVEGEYTGPTFSGNTPDAASADGSAWNDYSWVGTANASVSLWKQDIRLTPFADMAPVPRVLVDAATSLFPAGSVTVSLTRTAEGRTFDVRGGQKLPAASPAVIMDPEAPFGVVSAYTVLGHDADGNLIGSWPIGTVTLPYDKTVIQQPLDARLAATVDRLDGTGFELVRSTPGALAYPQGRVLPGVVGLGPRRGLEGVTLNLVAESQTEANNLQATLGTYDVPQLPIWLVRTPPGKRIPRVFFCHVPELVELDTYGPTGSGFVHFQAEVTEVKPPAAGITAAVLTHSDMKVFFSTHTGVKAQYATHSDVRRDTSLIGAADA